MPIQIKKKKAHSLTGRITYELMERAFKTVKRNRGAAGIDPAQRDECGDVRG